MFEKPALPTDFCCLGNNLLGDTAVVLLYATCDGAGLGGIFKNNQVGRFSSRSPCCVLLALSWNTTNENPNTDMSSRAIN